MNGDWIKKTIDFEGMFWGNRALRGEGLIGNELGWLIKNINEEWINEST